MGLTVKLAKRGERYLPNVGDNRTSDSPCVVTLDSPTVAQWRLYQSRIIERRQALAEATGKKADEVALPALDPEIEGPLFAECVKAIEGLALEDGTAITTGAQFWELRDRLDRDVGSTFMSDIFSAIYLRATLDEGSVSALRPRSGSPVSEAPTDGIAETAGSAAST